jgi:hypothetical protein
MRPSDSRPRPLDESLVHRWIFRVLDAFNTRDLDRLVELVSDDVVFDHSASPTTMRGRAEVRSFYAANHKAFRTSDSRSMTDRSCTRPRPRPASFCECLAPTQAQSTPWGWLPPANESRSTHARACLLDHAAEVRDALEALTGGEKVTVQVSASIHRVTGSVPSELDS